MPVSLKTTHAIIHKAYQRVLRLGPAYFEVFFRHHHLVSEVEPLLQDVNQNERYSAADESAIFSALHPAYRTVL